VSLAFSPLQVADLDVVLGLIEEFYALEFIQIPFVAERSRRVLTELIEEPRWGQAWLITEDREPIGYLVLTFGFSLEYHGRDALLDELYIRESHRRQGVGTAALTFVRACAGSLAWPRSTWRSPTPTCPRAASTPRAASFPTKRIFLPGGSRIEASELGSCGTNLSPGPSPKREGCLLLHCLPERSEGSVISSGRGCFASAQHDQYPCFPSIGLTLHTIRRHPSLLGEGPGERFVPVAAGYSRSRGLPVPVFRPRQAGSEPR
jgi:GNAT superfamily N-acetyltransferase